MRVLFVALGWEQLSISLLGAILRRAGHQVGLSFSPHLFDDNLYTSLPLLARVFRRDDELLREMVAFRPDVVCFSAITDNYRWMLSMAEKVKSECGATTVFGGVHPSAVPDIVLEEPAVDYVCVGDGELALPLLLEELRKGPATRPVPNMVFRRGGTLVRGPRLPYFADLDSLPGFEKDLWEEHMPLDLCYMTMSSRGCPYRCSFCFNNFFANLPGADRMTSGRYVRQRSVDHFMSELREAKRRYGVRYVDILDDIFTLDQAWLDEFSVRYRREIGVPFACLSHAQYLDEGKVRALKEAGCAWVQIGAQSADDDYKKTRLRRYEGNAQVDHALGLLERAGIKTIVDHIFGFPGEDLSSQDRAWELYSKHDLGRVGTYWLAYYPGTEMMTRAVAEGVLPRAQADDIDRGIIKNYHALGGNVEDPELGRIYMAYQVAFRANPLLPAAWRRKVKPDHLKKLPVVALRALELLLDVAGSFVQRSPLLRAYFAHYMRTIENYLRRAVGLAPRRRFAAGSLSTFSPPAFEKVLAEARMGSTQERVATGGS